MADRSLNLIPVTLMLGDADLEGFRQLALNALAEGTDPATFHERFDVHVRDLKRSRIAGNADEFWSGHFPRDAWRTDAALASRQAIWPNEFLPSGSSVDDVMKVVVAAFINAEEAGVEPASAVALAELCRWLIESTPEEFRPALDEKLSRGMLCHTLQVYMLFQQALREVRDGV